MLLGTSLRSGRGPQPPADMEIATDPQVRQRTTAPTRHRDRHRHSYSLIAHMLPVSATRSLLASSNELRVTLTLDSAAHANLISLHRGGGNSSLSTAKKL